MTIVSKLLLEFMGGCWGTKIIEITTTLVVTQILTHCEGVHELGTTNLKSNGDGEEYVARLVVVHTRGCR